MDIFIRNFLSGRQQVPGKLIDPKNLNKEEDEEDLATNVSMSLSEETLRSENGESSSLTWFEHNWLLI